MEKPLDINPEDKFSSPEEEIKYLKERIALREKELSAQFEKTPHKVDRENIIREEIRHYAKEHPDDLLDKGHRMIGSEAKEIALELSPETHDTKMEELLALLSERGLKNTLSIVSEMQNPHIEDDFHRFLTQFFKAGYIQGEDARVEVVKSLGFTLFEVAFPESKEESDKPLKELISSMEQWYEGILPPGERQPITLELASAEGSSETAFYISVPDSKKNLFEKQLLSVFPKAKIYEKKDDYNVFNYSGISLAAEAHLAGNAIFSLKTYDEFDLDPLNTILNAFSKIKRDGEGAAIQLVITRDNEGYMHRYKDTLHAIQNGATLKRALDIRHTLAGEFAKTAKNLFGDELKSLLGGAPQAQEKKQENNETAVEEIKKKVATPIMHANIRILASAPSRSEATDVLHSLIASFSQFENTMGTALIWHELPEKSFSAAVREFSYREFDKKKSMPLSVAELTTLMHFPQENISSPHLKVATSRTAPAPSGLALDGILIGVNRDRNIQTHVYYGDEDRLRHMYVIGQTGTGKTTFLKNMIAQDIKRGAGVCMIDPHGSDIQDILSIIPADRINDLIYFDPGYADRPMALNMLEYDVNFPEQKTFVVNELLSIFNKLFDMKTAGGPMFEQYFRNAVLLVMEDPQSGNTLFDVSRVLADKVFREMKLSKCKNPIVVQFWREIAGKAGGEASLQNMVPYITSKFDVFLSNDIMRPIISQEKSVLNFREIMDSKKILLVNLSKGRLGDINANLIGLIIVGKILMAALSRVDSLGSNLPPFYLYIDEFQNITTNSISQILSEARKYNLSLTIAHQFIAQLEDEIKDAVFGNVGSIGAFRVGAEDAETLEKQFEPVFEQFDLLNLDNRNAYMRLLSRGKPVRPFSLETLPFVRGDQGKVDKLKELSYLTYGKDRLEIENEIKKRFEAPKVEAAQPNPFANLKV